MHSLVCRRVQANVSIVSINDIADITCPVSLDPVDKILEIRVVSVLHDRVLQWRLNDLCF